MQGLAESSKRYNYNGEEQNSRHLEVSHSFLSVMMCFASGPRRGLDPLPQDTAHWPLDCVCGARGSILNDTFMKHHPSTAEACKAAARYWE